MVQLIKNISLKLLLILGIIQNSFENSTLKKKYISKMECDKESGRYLFNITAELSGNLSKSYIEKIKIETNENNPHLITKCNFPEKNSENDNIEISIPCYIENYKYAYYYYTLSFKEESNELQLINFEDINLGYIYCKRELTLILGKIKDQECDDSSSYQFKIEILNNTIIPEDLMHHYFASLFLF